MLGNMNVLQYFFTLNFKSHAHILKEKHTSENCTIERKTTVFCKYTLQM